MNRQEAFDKVATHLLKQNKRAHNQHGCQYKTTDGLKCAFGCLIPADLYDSEMEGQAIEDLFDNWPKLRAHVGVRNQDLLVDLQEVHDIRPVPEWKMHLETVADDWKLNTKVLQ